VSAALSVQIADEVTALLNAATSGTFTPSFIATRRYAPYMDLKELATLAVSVVPASREQTFASRNRVDADHEIKIYVQKYLTKAQDAAQIDPLTLLVEAIGDFLAGDNGAGQTRRLLATSQASLMKLAGPILFTKELVERQEFTGLVTATYNTGRAFR
jgi:hypothetical protein